MATTASFQSAAEFRTVLDRVFTMMSEDPEIGPRLHAADVPQRFAFPDLDLVVNIRATYDEEYGNLIWVWSDDVDWEPRVRMEMASDTANRYFQGKESIALAVARRRIKTSGDVMAALTLIPIIKPVHAAFARVVEAEYPHLRI
ncbi:hypothetical protein DSM112329_01556 [Paraconexibacter sp. AEG42_29]|uniref:SCP2 domain-containing protein n=1 Tax=Paraconexibacter sp. AEG42_29 TaxID=2997339 RepID=A0AAU7ASV0_9ACTN